MDTMTMCRACEYCGQGYVSTDPADRYCRLACEEMAHSVWEAGLRGAPVGDEWEATPTAVVGERYSGSECPTRRLAPTNGGPKMAERVIAWAEDLELRDLFAAAALGGLLASAAAAAVQGRLGTAATPIAVREALAAIAYLYADAMTAARSAPPTDGNPGVIPMRGPIS